jgi:hypothetical protein
MQKILKRELCLYSNVLEWTKSGKVL